MHGTDNRPGPETGLRGFWKRVIYIQSYGGFALRSRRRDEALKALDPPRWEDLPPAARVELAGLHADRAVPLAALGELFRSERVVGICRVCKGGCCATGSQTRFGLSDYYLARRPDVDREEIVAIASRPSHLLGSVCSLLGQLMRSVPVTFRRRFRGAGPEGTGTDGSRRDFPHVLGLKSPNWDHTDTSACPWLGPQGCLLPRGDYPSVCNVWLCEWLCEALTLEEVRELVRGTQALERVDDRVVACIARHVT